MTLWSRPPTHGSHLSLASCPSIVLPVCLLAGREVEIVSNHAEAELLSSFFFRKLIQYQRSCWRSLWTMLFPGTLSFTEIYWVCEQCWAWRRGLKRGCAWFHLKCFVFISLNQAHLNVLTMCKYMDVWNDLIILFLSYHRCLKSFMQSQETRRLMDKMRLFNFMSQIWLLEQDLVSGWGLIVGRCTTWTTAKWATYCTLKTSFPVKTKAVAFSN